MKKHIKLPMTLRLITRRFLIGLTLLILLYNGHTLQNQNLELFHECRFWGMIISEKTPLIDTLIITHLDSLCKLGTNNPDGWGIGYFIQSIGDSLLPLIRQGEPSAPLDPRYFDAVYELMRNMNKTAVAHVRKGSSGPPSGIPDPHPFRRKCLRRNLDLLFAHNGNINVDILMKLIENINPSYLEQNPPDYAPNYLDSDLWAILVVEILDMYPDLSIEECLRMAVAKLDSALETQTAQLNFVMSSGNTMWALNFTKSEPEAITVYYYPNDLVSNYWVTASQPLDTFTQQWLEIPNRTLARFRPNEPVLLIPIYRKQDMTIMRNRKNAQSRPNPFNQCVAIDYYVAENGVVSINIYDESGRLVRNLLKKIQMPGEYTIYWDGLNDRNIPSANGIYFCKVKDMKNETVLKFVFDR